jgi:hypothetical protein
MIYFMDRNYPSLHDDFDPMTPRTSEISRFFVGKFFSSNPPKSKLRNAEKTQYIICGNDLSNNSIMTEFRIYPNIDGSFELVTSDMSGYTSPFRVSEKIDFNPADLLNFERELLYRGKLQVSDFKTLDSYTYEISKSKYELPLVRFFKNNIMLGEKEELMCGLND